MPLIKCVDCGKMISDRIENCPECGCPVSVSVEENQKLLARAEEEAKIKAEEEKNRIEEEINAPAVKMEIDMDSELDTLYDLFAPAVLNEREITKVGDKIMAHFKKYNTLGNGVVSAACNDLERAFTKHDEVIKYVDEMKAKQLKMALNQYKSEMNKPIEGLGFGIISTSAADTMLYGAMSAHNAAKQYMKNTKTANENLHKNLIALGANSDNLMSETDVLDFKYKIRKAVENIKDLAEKKFFMDSHKEFKYHPEKYDNGKEIDGVRIYSILYRGENTRLLYISGPKSIIPRDILEKAEKEGYIDQYVGSYYCTTLKYEKEVLAEIFKEENPEEYAKLQAEQQSNAEVIYNKAIEDLNNGLYYEAATALGSISGYKDAIEISVKLWHEKILCQDWFVESLGSYFMLKDDGTVFAGGRAKDEAREKIAKWQGVDKIYDMEGPAALTFDGKLLGTVPFMYAGYTGAYAIGRYAQWKKLKSVSGRFTYVGVKKDGTVLAMGKNENGICEKCADYTNIVKASAMTTENIALLTKDGKVNVIGGDYKDYETWEDVVDVVSDYSGLYGFKKDGSVYFLRRGDGGSLEKYKTYYGTHPSEWKDIYKYFGDCKAIDKYGRVYNYGSDEVDKKLAGLKDIVHIEKATSFTVCIKADGSLHVINSKVDISKWENVISVWGSYNFAIGLKPDGTLLMEGDIKNREELENWKLFEHINKRRNLKEEYVTNKRLAEEKELADAKNELANLKGLFAGMRRKQLEARISELEEELK